MNRTSDSIVTRSELALLNVLQSHVWIFDIERMQMWWANLAALSLWNAASLEELLNRNWSDVSQSTRTRLQTYLEQFKQGKSIVDQWTFYPKQQAVVVRCSFSGIRIEAGRLAMLAEGVTDIMECINSENLRSIEALRHATVMISFYTFDGVPVMQNPAAIQCYGDEKNVAAADNAFCKRFVEHSVAEQAMACIAAGEVFSTETQVVTLKGIRWHGLDVRRTNDPTSGQPLILINEREISDRKQVEEQLQQYAAQLQQVLAFEAMLKRITDKVRDSLDESQILQTAVRELALVPGVSCCNTALYDLEQGTSTICYEYANSDPGAQARVMQIASFPEIYQQLLQCQHCQFCSIHPNPVRGRVAMLACPIFDDQGVLGDLWLINQHDHAFSDLEIRLVQQVANQCAIALRQARLYQASLAQVAELEKLNQLKDNFLSTISHELRTPVSNMKMGIHMLTLALSQEMPNLEGKKAARYLQILQDECDREIDLISDLLDLQRLDAGALPLEIATIQLQEWLPAIAAPFQEQAKHHQQTLQVDLHHNLPPLVSAPANLKRIITELLNNACKYTPTGQRIVVTAYAAAKTIQIAVSNSGVEIPASELQRVFDKFYRVPSNDPWKQGGTGLGLALAQSLAEHLGGSIRASSSASETVFTLELPVVPPGLDNKI